MQHLIVPVPALIVISILLWGVAHAQIDEPKCLSPKRWATADEIDRLKKVGFPVNAVGGRACIDAIAEQFLGGTFESDIDFLKQRMCGTYTYGIPAGFNEKDTDPAQWRTIKNNYVYFAAGDTSMNPGSIKCFRQFFELAEQKGFKPCISAALRTPAHQRASCMDPANTVVCGRRGDASTCPNDLLAYTSCPHVNGYSMDINDQGGQLSNLLDFAKSFNGFSRVGVGAHDPWHIEARNCADPNFKPNTSITDSWTPPPTRLPTSSFADAVRTALGTPPPQQPLFQPQQFAQSQSPLNSFPQVRPEAVAPVQQTSPGSSQQPVSDRLSLIAGADADIATTSTADRLAEILFGITPQRPTPSTGSTTPRASSTPPNALPLASSTLATPPQTTFITRDLSFSGEQNRRTTAAQESIAPPETSLFEKLRDLLFAIRDLFARILGRSTP